MSTTIETAKRQYRPTYGTRVKFALGSDYTTRGINLWAWMRVISQDDQVALSGDLVALEVLNGDTSTGETLAAHVSTIEKPIGWQERYTIHVHGEKLATLLDFMQRGLVVRQSQYIGDGSVQYQAADAAETTHWKYTQVTDRLTADEVVEFVKVVKVDSTFDAGIPAKCEYCAGTGIRQAQACHLNNAHLKPTPVNIGDSFDCWTCNKGQSIRHLAAMDAKERKLAIAELAREGWKVWYQKVGRVWRMERETVVKEFGQAVPVVPASPAQEVK